MVAMCCKTAQQVPAVNSSGPKGFSSLILVPKRSDVAIAHSHWPGTSFASLKKGYSIFNVKCTSCHLAKKPQDFTEFAWTGIMRRMARKAKLDSSQYDLVLHYVLARQEAIMKLGK